MIIVSIIGFDSSFPWPGSLALAPVLGTAAILMAAQPASRWTGSLVAQWIGSRSYSLYLWHWPIAVALNYLELQKEFIAIGAGLGLTLILGELSYRLVEIPARVYLGHLKTFFSSTLLIGSVAAVASLGVGIQSMQGVTGRFPKSVELAADERINTNPRTAECFVLSGTNSPSCVYGGSNLRAILLGDSHANSVTTGLKAALKESHDGIMSWGYSGCPTIFGVKEINAKVGSKRKCGDFLLWADKQLQELPKEVPLVIVNRTSVYALGHNEPWEKTTNTPLVYFTKPYRTITPEFIEEFSKELTDTACFLSKNRTVYLMRPIPEMGIDVPKTISRALSLGKTKEISISLSDYHQRHSVVWDAQNNARDRCGVKILDVLPYLCQDGRCHATKNGRPIYSDDDHLSEFGNKILTPMFAEIFSEISDPIRY